MLASPVNQPPGSTVNSMTRSESFARSVTGPTNAVQESSLSETLFVLRRLDTSAEPVLLTSGRWSVGTAEGNRLQIIADGVGARHCLIIATPLRTIIKSWDTETWLNDQPISDAELRPSDELKIGNSRFSVCSPESNELISQLPCVADASVADNGDRSEGDLPTGRVHEQLSRIDELTATLDALSDELQGREESSVRLDQMIERLQQTIQSPHVDSETARSSDDFTADPTVQVERQPHEISCEGDKLVSSKAVENERERLAIEFDAKSRQLDAHSDSLETRTAVLDAQSCEISERLTEQERGRQDLNGAQSDVKQQRLELARQQEKLRVGLEELDYQREAVQAEASDLRSLYETLNERFPEASAALADDVVELHTATAEDCAVPQLVEDRDADAEICDTDDTSDDTRQTDEACDLSALATEADAIDAGFDDMDATVVVETPSAGFDMDDSDSSRNEEASKLDLEKSSESSWEMSQLILERIRFGRLVEELQPASAPTIDEDDNAETPVPVGATSLLSRHVTTNTLRSRDAAVRELDELVLAATTSANSDSTRSDSALINPPDESSTAADAGVANPESADDGSQDEPEHDEFDDSIGDYSAEDDATQSDETQNEPEWAHVEHVEEVAPDDSADAATASSDVSDSISLLDRLKQSVAAELDISVEPDADPLVDDEGASAASDTVSTLASESISESGSLLSSMFGAEAGGPDEPMAADPDAGDQQTAQDDASFESVDAPDDAEPEDGSDLRTQLADIFDLQGLNDHAEEPPSETPLDERFGSLYVDRDEDVDVEIADVADHRVGDVVDQPTPDESVVENGEEDSQVNSYMQQLLARNRLQTGVPEVETTIPVPEREREDSVEPAAVSDDDEDRSWLEEGPLHKQDRSRVLADTQAFRELANQSARSAVDTAKRKQLRAAVMVKTLASVSALVVGTVSMLMDLSWIFGLAVLGIGFVFTLDLLITVARNWSGAAKVARDRRAGKVSNGNAAVETAEESSDALLKRDDKAGPEVEANVSENRLAGTVQVEIKPVRNAVPEAPTAEFENRVRELFGESGADTTDEKPSDGEAE